MAIEWTNAQKMAIEAKTRTLVSAAAGSGKTAVLSRRCADRIVKDGCEAAELCVVTFTQAAAMEMRSRIEREVREAAMADPSNKRLEKQSALIGQARIGTLHALCGQLLRENFQNASLDPDFRVFDNDEASLLRLETAADLFVDQYEKNDPQFAAFVADIGAGKDRMLIQRVVEIHETLRGMVDPTAWINQSLERIAESCDKPLRDSFAGQRLLASLSRHFQSLASDARWTLNRLRELKFLTYVQFMTPKAEYVESIADLLARGHYEIACDKFQLLMDDPGRLPSVSKDTPNRDLAKDLVNDIRKRIAEASKFLLFKESEWRKAQTLILPHARVLLRLVEEFAAAYESVKRGRNALDFNDLERLTRRLLLEEDGKTPSSTALRFRRRHKHLLVDEFQDINELQDSLLDLLCGRPGERGPVLFCVGDVKQSIYGFRLADPARFVEKRDLYLSDPSAGQVIDLQSNFRSRGSLLESLNGIFERLFTRETAGVDYDDAQRLIPGAKYPKADNALDQIPVELHLLPDKVILDQDQEPDIELEQASREAMFIAREIRQLVDSKKRVFDHGFYRPIQYRDCVILLRAMKFHAEKFALVLRQMGIPVHNSEGGGYFQATEVRDVLELLRILDNPAQDIPLAAFLRSPMARLDDADAAMASIRTQFPGIPFHAAVRRYSAEMTDALALRLGQILGRIDAWRDLSRVQPVADLIWTLFDDTGYLAFVQGLPSGSRRVANLLNLFDRARQFGAFSRQGLHRFIRFLTDLDEQTEVSQASDLSEAENVVRILSVHKSKGLEYPVVFLPQLGKRFNLQSAEGNILVDRAAGLGLSAVDPELRVRYPSLSLAVVKDNMASQNLAEELRILYVAMTRARERLYLIASETPNKLEQWQSRWSAHVGPIPAGSVQNSSSAIDCMAPAACALSAKELDLISITEHPSEEIVQWIGQFELSPRLAEVPDRFVQAQPLACAPIPDPRAAEMLRILQWEYPHMQYVDLQATAAVTSLVKHDFVDSAPCQLYPPSRLRGDALELVATERGTAVHKFLECLDFSQPVESLPLQLEAMVKSRILTPRQGEVCDMNAIAWMLNEPLGGQMRKYAKELMRELPVIRAVSPARFNRDEETDPRDRVMLRGRVDMLLQTDDGYCLVDYKTDQVDGTELEKRAADYKTQLELYREALEPILKVKIASAALIFLHPRRIVQW